MFTVFLGGLCTAIILTPIGFLRRSWIELAIAAGLAMVVAVITMFAIGAIVFALTCLDLFAALTLRMGAGWWGWVLAMLGAASTWTSLVVLPRHVSEEEPWDFLATWVPLSSLLVAVVLLIVGPYDRRSLTPSS